MKTNFIKIRMTHHEKLHIPETRENFLCRRENTLFGVLFIHYELCISGENITEISVNFDKIT